MCDPEDLLVQFGSAPSIAWKIVEQRPLFRRQEGGAMKDAILQYFEGNWRPFFEGYLSELKPAGKQYRALCPFHDDHHPSLDVDPTKGLWHCKVCNIGGDPFKLVEKLASLDFPAVLQDIRAKFGISGNSSKPKPVAPGRLVKRYTYQDADRSALFCKNRYEPKGFSICRPNGHGGYHKGMGGVTPVLYRLPELIAADEVWVVEGEKDADALAELGVVATTNFDGAGKWSESYNESLRGKRVILIPDDDKSGRDHVQKVAVALYGVAASIKILELPNPAGTKGFDVYDFITEQPDSEKAAERLAILSDGVADWTPEAEEEKPADEKRKPGPPILDDDCFLEQLTDSDPDSNDQYEWLIDRLVPKGEPMVIAGKGASGKSSLALEFSAQIMEKDPEAGVVYICAEGTYRDTKVKARKMGLTKHNRFYFLKRKGGGTSFKFSEKRDLEMVTKALEDAQDAGNKIVFVVIDSIRGMAKGSLNEDGIGEVMQAVNAELSGKLEITVCYIHHGRKNDKDMTAMDAFLGSVTIVNAIRYGLFVRKTGLRRTVEVAKSNLGYDDMVFDSEIDTTGRIQLTCTGVIGAEDGSDPTKLELAEEVILSYLGQGNEAAAFQIYECGKGQGISDKTMKKAKKELKVKSYQKGNRWYWRIPESLVVQPESFVDQKEIAPCPPRQSNLSW
jgi:hypothetical protein